MSLPDGGNCLLIDWLSPSLLTYDREPLRGTYAFIVGCAPWGSGFPRPGDLGTQLDTVGVPPWNIHVFRFIPGRGQVAGF